MDSFLDLKLNGPQSTIKYIKRNKMTEMFKIITPKKEEQGFTIKRQSEILTGLTPQDPIL